MVAEETRGDVAEALLLTKAQAAALAGVGVRSIERLLCRGVLTRVSAGLERCVRVERAELEQWVRQGCPDRPGWRGRRR